MLLLAFYLLVSPFGEKVYAQETEQDNSQYMLTQEELCNVFPEYSEKISAANNLVDQKARTISSRTIEEIVYEEIEDGDTYSIAFYDDGTYTAVRSYGYNVNLTGTENAVLTNYVANRNSIYYTETSSRLAGAHFYIANNYFVFQVGNNGWSIILDGGTIFSEQIF